MPLIAVDGLQFKDLNRNGVLDPYEDWRLPAVRRAQDLVGRMTLEEKAGAMMHANPPTVGFAAAGDPELVRKFADSLRQEYLAVGIRTALSPQADLTTNPRWHRVNGTFGNDPQVAEKMVRAYVGGMQNGEQGLGPGSVISVVKHWVGYGATGEEGFDAHNYYGRHLNLSDDTIEQHILPFTGAFAAQVGGVMPSYGQPPSGLTVRGSAQPIEPVGVGFNRQLLTDVLRGRFKFDGVILSDWQITDGRLTQGH